MAPTPVQNKDGTLTTATTYTVTYTAGPTATNLLFGVWCAGAGGSNPGAITMPTNWTQAFLLQRGTAQLIVCGFRVAGVAETSAVAIRSANSVGWIGSIYEYSGMNVTQASVLDRTQTSDGGAGTITTLTSGTTLTTTATAELAVAGWGISGLSGGTESVTQSFAIRDVSGDKVIIATKVLAATGTVESTATWATARTGVAGVATFKGLPVSTAETLNVTNSQTAQTLANTAGHPRTLAATQAQTSTVADTASHPRALAVTETQTPTVTDAATHPRSLAATETQSPTLTEAATHPRSLAAIETQTPVATTQDTYRRSLAATETQTPALATASGHPRTLAVTETETPSLALTATHPRVLNVTETQTATIATIANIATGLPIFVTPSSPTGADVASWPYNILATVD